MNWLPKISIAGAVFLASMCVIADASADLTGVHRTQTICDRRNSANGAAYMAPCYEGYRHQLGVRYTLVQNGASVCGSFEACGGFNCSKVYAGEVVGKVTGNKVTLYSADGHHVDGEAIVDVFKISARGELLELKSDKRAYVKIPLKNIDPELKSMCQPEFKEPVLLKDYELDIQGGRVDLNKVVLPEKPAFLPPKDYVIGLKETSEKLEIQDGAREAGNLIPRTVRIHNATSKSWTISADTPPDSTEDLACSEWLRTSETKSASYVWAYDQNSHLETIPPKSTRYTRICTGDTLTVEKVLPECPKFECLRTCRC